MEAVAGENVTKLTRRMLTDMTQLFNAVRSSRHRLFQAAGIPVASFGNGI
ncbi:hypothetical protein [Burkholderia contaminans]